MSVFNYQECMLRDRFHCNIVVVIVNVRSEDRCNLLEGGPLAWSLVPAGPQELI